jgi:hypothetical protein
MADFGDFEVARCVYRALQELWARKTPAIRFDWTPSVRKRQFRAIIVPTSMKPGRTPGLRCVVSPLRRRKSERSHPKRAKQGHRHRPSVVGGVGAGEGVDRGTKIGQVVMNRSKLDSRSRDVASIGDAVPLRVGS